MENKKFEIGDLVKIINSEFRAESYFIKNCGDKIGIVLGNKKEEPYSVVVLYSKKEYFCSFELEKIKIR